MENSNEVNHILIKLKDKINEIEKHKLDPDFILHVCNLIENSFPSSNKHIDKKDLALQVIIKVFSLNDNDKLEISNQIDFLHQCGKIRRTSLLCCARHYLSSLLNK